MIEQMIVMDDGWVLYLLMFATRDEILSVMVEIWMKHHLVSDKIATLVVYKPPPPPKKRFTRNDK